MERKQKGEKKKKKRKKEGREKREKWYNDKVRKSALTYFQKKKKRVRRWLKNIGVLLKLFSA